MLKLEKGLVLLVLVALATCHVTAANAGFVTGSELLDSCRPQRIDPVYRLKVAECRGYVIGVADSFDCTRQNYGFAWDSTSPVTQPDLVNIVLKWLDRHPDMLHHKADGLVAAALDDAYPCI